ncbi:MAG: TylF/MycF/NovP-related O-methyltransferase [Agitococcus sp.]
MARKKIILLNNTQQVPNIYHGWQHINLGVDVTNDLSQLNQVITNSYHASYSTHLLEEDSLPTLKNIFSAIYRSLTTDGFAHLIISNQHSQFTENDLVNLLIEQGFYQVYTGTDEANILAFAFKNKPSHSQLVTIGLENEPKIEKPSYLPAYTRPTENMVTNFFYPVFWGTETPQQFSDTMVEMTKKVAGGFHFADNFFTWLRNMSMFDDKPFVQAWDSNTESESDKAIVWRRYVLACAAYHCVQLEGDFVECGAYTGVGIKTIIDYLGGVNFPKMFWGYDLFEHNDSMVNHAMPEHGAGLYERVQEKFINYPQVELIKGFIPDCFEDNCPEKIAYLHIDLNQAPAEIAALEHLFDRVVPGGIIILDDYEWSGIYRPQKLAEDEWFEQRNYKVMPLPTGQGLVFKR